MTIPPSTLALADAAVGDRVLIVLINCGASNGRLAQEGLSLGQEVTILSHTSSGSVIVQAPRQNIGLSAALAQNIYVDLSRE